MGILDDAIREHLELKRAHGAPEDEIQRKESEAFGPVRQDAVPAAAEEAPPGDETALLQPADLSAAPADADAGLAPPPAIEPAVPAPEDPYAVHPGDHAVPDPSAAPAAYEAAGPDPAAFEAAAPAPDLPAVAPSAEPEIEPAQSAAEDPYAVHPGDHAVRDPHHEGEPGGKDPAWREDTDFFADEPAYPEEPSRAEHEAAEHAAQAGAGELAESHVDPGPPFHPEERHPALSDTDEHFHAGSEPPEPVFRHEPRAASAPEAPTAPPAEPAPVDDPPVGDPPVERPEIDEPPPRQSPEEASGEEDVLEETPEFLQDAPEHDRLWFEQKPPRDFDFGE